MINSGIFPADDLLIFVAFNNIQQILCVGVMIAVFIEIYVSYPVELNFGGIGYSSAPRVKGTDIVFVSVPVRKVIFCYCGQFSVNVTFRNKNSII